MGESGVFLLRFVGLNIECAAKCDDRVVVVVLPAQAIEDVDRCVHVTVWRYDGDYIATGLGGCAGGPLDC